MSKIKGIFEGFGPEYITTFPNLPRNHRKVIQSIIDCRSGRLGKTIYQCQDCGQVQVISQSCGNRHCPVCQYHKSQQWLQKQLERMLSGQYFMITFTIPEQLRSFIRCHQDKGYSAMFTASSQSLKRLAGDPKYIGAQLIGFTGILHTWGRQLNYHPHIHYLVPGGRLSADRKTWMASNNGFFVPVKALSKIYKALFKEQMSKAELLTEINPDAWTIDWNVNSQAVGDGRTALKYLAPYVFRVAIGKSRIVNVQNRTVTFTCKQHGSNRIRTMVLNVLEFMRRFLQHVLPSGFMKVRHYGFMNASCKIKISDIQALISTDDWEEHCDSLPESKDSEAGKLYCPDCEGLLVFIKLILPCKAGFWDSG
ncbi:IS91 family transposase [Desulfonatronovibrio magnus]|uniref:IS91 family transposase n=1 Tax=Desulfonatronovibrio magnus TaxID=698827 RepID=UPI000697C86D|nr:transposase [Desulfonatronovibrio magnus]